MDTEQADTQHKLGMAVLPPAPASLLPSVIMGSHLGPPLCLVPLVLVLLFGGKPGSPHPFCCPQHPPWALPGQASSACLFRCEHDTTALAPKALLSRGSRDQRGLLPASQGGPSTGVCVSLWLLPVPCAGAHLPILRILERPADPRPEDCQEGRVQRLEGSEGGHGPSVRGAMSRLGWEESVETRQADTVG